MLKLKKNNSGAKRLTRALGGVSTTPRSLYPLERDAVPIVQEDGWAPGPVWTVAENLAPTEIRSSDHTAVASRYTGWSVPAVFNKDNEL